MSINGIQNPDNQIKSQELNRIGNEMYELMVELYPICRSITGDGVRKSLSIISKHVNIKIHEVATGTKVYDWTIPKEWNIKDAYILDPNGEKIIDFKKSNLHVLNYSIPIKKKLPLSELKLHLHTLPDLPDFIPYLTSYYKEDWGFCMSHNQFQKLEDGQYEINIESTLKDGHLTYGEYFIRGKKEDEFLITCYICHPSLCNDNLSGTVLITFLAKYLSSLSLQYSYRFLFIPETIGSITWLSKNEDKISRIKYGLVATCVGDAGSSTYKKSRRGDTMIDKAVIHVLKYSGSDYKIVDFFPSGSDERQFCSPAFDLPVGSLIRTMYGQFLEYHTSADNLEFVKREFLTDSFSKYLSVMYTIEHNKKYMNLNPKCEPQLGKRGLYRMIGGQKQDGIDELALFWVLNLSDGKNSLLDIAERSGLPFDMIKRAADALINSNLIQELDN